MKESRTNLNASACIHRGKLYVFGGEQKGSHWKDYHGTECYDFNTGTWSYFKSLIPIFKKKSYHDVRYEIVHAGSYGDQDKIIIIRRWYEYGYHSNGSCHLHSSIWLFKTDKWILTDDWGSTNEAIRDRAAHLVTSLELF